jgi:hypothetical protein
MSENKGKPSQQKMDERKERDATGSRTSHRLDRSRSDEKGGKGASPKRATTPARAGSRRA